MLAAEAAAVPLSSIEYAYGFGVYEHLRVKGGIVYFLDAHVERLLASAEMIRLSHEFSGRLIGEWAGNLADAVEEPAFNIKMLLIGAPRPQDAALYMLPLRPFFPDDALYKKGASCVLYEHERPFPRAKTLSMLGSYLAYREARERDAYEALLVDRAGFIREGTRTNFFCLRGNAIVSPPRDRILHGVTRRAVLAVAKAEGYGYREADIRPEDLPRYDAAFLTSTSSKIMPIRSAGEHEFGAPSGGLIRLMSAFDSFLLACGGALPGGAADEDMNAAA